ncbi:MAG: LacI family DNA-binding transcriptional regulator [Betaproteobacteria bacterium]
MKPSRPAPAERPLPSTIRDVAAAAGVSLGTVSKGLNGTGQLREETRQRVHQAAKQLNFRPNHLAQSLLRGRSFTVGLVSTDRYGRFSIPVMEGIEDALGSARMSVFLCSGADDPDRERERVEQLLMKRVDAIIVTARRADPRAPLKAPPHSVPILYAFAQVDDPGALCLLPDDLGGGRLAAEHLIAAGRRRIAHITGPEDFEAVRHRSAGFRLALEQGGLPYRSADVMFGSWSENWGREAVEKLLARNPKIDAIFCGSDQIARGAVDSMRDLGVRVPHDVAVVGFDNWQIIAAATRPPLTTIDMNLHELGRQAGLRLLDMIDGKDQQHGVIRLPCTLVVRESCGARRPTVAPASSTTSGVRA